MSSMALVAFSPPKSLAFMSSMALVAFTDILAFRSSMALVAFMDILAFRSSNTLAALSDMLAFSASRTATCSSAFSALSSCSGVGTATAAPMTFLNSGIAVARLLNTATSAAGATFFRSPLSTGLSSRSPFHFSMKSASLDTMKMWSAPSQRDKNCSHVNWSPRGFPNLPGGVPHSRRNLARTSSSSVGLAASLNKLVSTMLTASVPSATFRSVSLSDEASLDRSAWAASVNFWISCVTSSLNSWSAASGIGSAAFVASIAGLNASAVTPSRRRVTSSTIWVETNRPRIVGSVFSNSRRSFDEYRSR